MPTRLGRTYLDSNIFIYATEAAPNDAVASLHLLQQLQSENQIPVTSEYALAECLVGVRKARASTLETHYLTYFAEPSIVEVHPVSREILIAAARWAGESATKLADAIHIATAVAAGCRSFATNDNRLRLPPSLNAVRLTTPPAGS